MKECLLILCTIYGVVPAHKVNPNPIIENWTMVPPEWQPLARPEDEDAEADFDRINAIRSRVVTDPRPIKPNCCIGGNQDIFSQESLSSKQ